MLEEPFMTNVVEEKIRKMLLNTEAVFQTVIAEYENQFSKVQDSFFRQRLIDVQDLSQRVLNHLYFDHQVDFKNLSEPSIIIAKEFCPSHIAEATIHLVCGFVASFGSATSHAGLIARAKGIPFLIQIDHEEILQFEGELAIIDSENQLLIINPEESVLQKYREKKQKESELFDSFATKVPEGIATQDGTKVHVYANLDAIQDMQTLAKYHADGVGLFRSEFLFFEGDQNNLREETQLKIYAKLADSVTLNHFVFRVFDFGADKNFLIDHQNELNPALGLRSVRFLLRYKDIFKTQLKTLFRAFNGKKLSLLLPFIADVEEILECKNLIYQVLNDLKEQVEIHLKIGAMIEMPSAVILCHQILEHVDFISVGTNDLIQYTLVADRQNATMQDIFKSTHPSIVLMLKMIIDCARKKEIPVCICGEMASNPLFTPLLLGLGYQALSCSPRYIPKIKTTVLKIDISKTKELVEKVLKTTTATEIHRLLTEYYLQLQYQSS